MTTICLRAALLALFSAALSLPAAAAERTARALKTEEPVVLDGVLDEAVWKSAEPASEFVQVEPRQGAPATEATEVRIVFDADNIYFGVVCNDSHPEAMLAKSLRVDFSPTEEDFFEVLLDPFTSSRDAFLFVTNPDGAKRDEQISNGGRENNVSWDGAWDVRTRRGAEGWTAEIRIPFKTLRYDSKNTKPWNINFGRQIRRHNELAYWSPMTRQFNIRQVSLAGHLEGLNTGQIAPGRNLSITPYYVLNRVDRAARKGVDNDAGADLKYGLTPGLTLDLTYNTDFSHVEVDQQQVNLDRFRLSFPEKRDFFLENAGLFDFGSVGAIFGRPLPESPMGFYSRNIGLSLAGRPVPVDGGGRLTGRVGKYSLGLMSIHTARGEDQVPETDTLMRVRRDFLRRSYLGGFFLSRSGPERDPNRVLGFDGLFRPRNDLAFAGSLSKGSVPGVHGDDWLLRVQASYDSRAMALDVTHANIQKNFRNDLGFILRNAVSANRIDWRPIFRPRAGSVLREIRGIINIRYITDPSGRLVTREVGGGADFIFQKGSLLRFRRRNFFDRLDDRFEIRRSIFIGKGDYNYHEDGIEANTDRSRTISGRMLWYTGNFWNGEKTSWEAAVQFRPNGHLNTEVSFSKDHVELPTGNFEVRQSGFRLQYSRNTRTFADMFIQYSSDTNRVTSNLRFNWIHRPLSDLFLVYTEERPTFGSARTDRVVSIKYTHLLSF